VLDPPAFGRDPVVKTPVDALLPALDARLRGHDMGGETGSASRHVGIRPTDALDARRYEERAQHDDLATMGFA